MLPPDVETSLATAAFDVAQVNVALDTAALPASNACALRVCVFPTVTVDVDGVTVTRVTVATAATVIAACANVPFVVAVAVMVADPLACGVTVTVDPLVVLSGATVALDVVQVNGTPAIAVFEASYAIATNC